MAAEDLYEVFDWRMVAVHRTVIHALAKNGNPHFMQACMCCGLFHAAEYRKLRRLSHDGGVIQA